MNTLTPTVSPELKALMRKLKLGQLLDTLPERLALAKSHDLTHSEFLEQLFSDEVTRRDADSAGRRARAARLDPHMVLEAWDQEAKVTYDHAVWSELVSMRFVEQARNAFILGPVGVGKTFMATSPVVGASACTSNGLTNFTSDSRHLGSTPATTKRCASSSASICSSSTILPSPTSTPRRRPTSTRSAWSAITPQPRC
jgi:hypothetical protein